MCSWGLGSVAPLYVRFIRVGAHGCMAVYSLAVSYTTTHLPLQLLIDIWMASSLAF